MGHKSEKTTKRYAVPELQLQMAKQRISFAALSGFNVNTSREMVLEILTKEKESFEAAIANERLQIEQFRKSQIDYTGDPD